MQGVKNIKKVEVASAIKSLARDFLVIISCLAWTQRQHAQQRADAEF